MQFFTDFCLFHLMFAATNSKASFPFLHELPEELLENMEAYLTTGLAVFLPFFLRTCSPQKNCISQVTPHCQLVSFQDKDMKQRAKTSFFLMAVVQCDQVFLLKYYWGEYCTHTTFIWHPSLATIVVIIQTNQLFIKWMRLAPILTSTRGKCRQH